MRKKWNQLADLSIVEIGFFLGGSLSFRAKFLPRDQDANLQLEKPPRNNCANDYWYYLGR